MSDKGMDKGTERGERGIQPTHGSPDDVDDIIDWDSPIVCQVAGVKGYNAFIHSPKFVKTSVRMFKNPLMECLSRTHWYVILIIWIPISVVFFVSGAKDIIDPLVCTFLFLFGMFSWTFFEYVLHRFLFHIDLEGIRRRVGGQSTSLGKSLTIIHFCMHGIHHKFPTDPLRLVFPPILTSIILVIIYGGVRIFTTLPVEYVNVTVSGILFGYVIYDTMHYMLHHHRDFKIAYFRKMKRYHIHHHFRDTQNGFGITSKLWDSLFSTIPPPPCQ